MKIHVFTDGSCKKDKTGGWAYVLVCLLDDGRRIYRTYKNACAMTTNQRMEVLAAHAALSNFTAPTKLHLHSDAAYLVNCIEDMWHVKWIANGWRNARGEPVANSDLWMKLIPLLDMHDVNCVKVKGHNGHFFNEYADWLANQAVVQYRDLENGKGGWSAHMYSELSDEYKLGESQVVTEDQLEEWGKCNNMNLQAAINELLR